MGKNEGRGRGKRQKISHVSPVSSVPSIKQKEQGEETQNQDDDESYRLGFSRRRRTPFDYDNFECHDDDDEPIRRSSLSVTLKNPEVLDCPICFNPFTIPVFQCLNGHTCCSSCRNKLGDKCPYNCNMSIGGYIRNRAIEDVLESAVAPCQNVKFGCKETVKYSNKYDHDQTCIYAPCSCPITGCNYIGSSELLNPHISSRHASVVKLFEFNSTITLSIPIDEEFVVVQEEKEGVSFIMNNTGYFGKKITVGCLRPLSMGGYLYDVSENFKGSRLMFQSVTECIQSRVENLRPSRFLPVPDEFYDASGQITLDLCIWRKGDCPWNIE